MAVVTRYFSTAAAGAGDGTTWANRAQLVSGATWSTVITGFSFAGSDSLEVRIGPGTHSPTAAMTSALFANAPSLANPIIFHGCDSSGNLLESPDPDWVSAQAEFSTAALPVIATTTAIQTSTLANSFWRLIYFTASGSIANSVLSGGNFDWIGILISGSSANNAGMSSPSLITNSFIKITGTAFDTGVTSPVKMDNVRIDGTAATGSGTRRGLSTSSAGHNVSRITVIGCAGGGILAAAGSATRSSYYSQCMLINNGTYGILCNATALQTVWHTITNCYFSGNGTYGIDANGSRTIASNNRLRDSTTADFANFGNYPTSYNYTTDSDNATEFVDSAAGDYRIKNTAAIWGKGYGAGDQPAGGAIGGGNLNGGFQ